MKIPKSSYMMCGEVNDEMVLNVAKALVGKKKNLLINSTGGDVNDGFALYDLIKMHNPELRTIGVGQVQSIAILPFLAGKRRICTANCRFMFHHGTFQQTQPEGQMEMRGIVKELVELDKKYQQLIVKHTKLSETEVKRLIKYGFYFDAQKALQMGFVHEII